MFCRQLNVSSTVWLLYLTEKTATLINVVSRYLTRFVSKFSDISSPHPWLFDVSQNLSHIYLYLCIVCNLGVSLSDPAFDVLVVSYHAITFYYDNYTYRD